jgi:D-arabinose 1-dehydrogenase-like Zn-dependent alcohol dehydrogenase
MLRPEAGSSWPVPVVVTGHLVCQISARAFSYRVVGVNSASKKALVRECGASNYIAIEKLQGDSGDRVSLVDKVKGFADDLGVAAAIVCTGHLEAYSQSLERLRFNGILVVVGVRESEQTPIYSTSLNTFFFH